MKTTLFHFEQKVTKVTKGRRRIWTLASLCFLLFKFSLPVQAGILNSSSYGAAQADTAGYLQTINRAGGSITPANAAALQGFAQNLYAITGRQDFYLCRSSQNAGTGSYVYSFQGKTMLLVNGPAWSGTGIVFSAASNQYASESGFPAQTAFTARTMMLCLSTGSVANAQMICTAPNFLNDGYGGISMNLVFGGNGLPFWQYGVAGNIANFQAGSVVTNWGLYTGVVSSGTISAYIGSSLVGSGTTSAGYGTDVNSPILMGPNPLSGTLLFHLPSTNILTAAQIATIHSLLQTLNSDLSIP